MQNLNSKVFIIVALIAGVIVGAYADSVLFSGPKIKTLDETIIDQNLSIDNLENQIYELENQLSSLQDLYTQLESNSIQEIDEKRIEIINLESQIDILIEDIEDRENSMSILEDQLEIINIEYDELRQEYELIYNPLEISYILNNLKITLITNTDKYPGNNAITGTVVINHIDGSPFIGNYKLTLYKLYINSSSSSPEFTINGISSYIWNAPFIQGPGTYYLSVSDIKDLIGNSIVSNAELKNHVLLIFTG